MTLGQKYWQYYLFSSMFKLNLGFGGELCKTYNFTVMKVEEKGYKYKAFMRV